MEFIGSLAIELYTIIKEAFSIKIACTKKLSDSSAIEYIVTFPFQRLHSI